jgi:hypothetical protein
LGDFSRDETLGTPLLARAVIRKCSLYVHRQHWGDVWPEAIPQLNPAYELGSTVDELAEQGVLLPATAQMSST